MGWYLKALRQYTDFTGRARRKEYWIFTLVNVIISFVLGFLDSVLDLVGNIGNIGLLNIGLLGGLYSLAVLLPSWAVGCRRLHDIGRRGWWQLIAIIPLIGWIMLIVFWATDGERQPNAYGPDPKAIPGEGAVFA
jgi:uncharacterized membrane protein YhaH (DUF805 family)